MRRLNVLIFAILFIAACTGPSRRDRNRMIFNDPCITDRRPVPSEPSLLDFGLSLGPLESSPEEASLRSRNDGHFWQLPGDGAQPTLTLIAMTGGRFRYFIGPYFDGYPKHLGDPHRNRYKLEEYLLTRHDGGWKVITRRPHILADMKKLDSLVGEAAKEP